MPCDYKRDYPLNWADLRRAVLIRANNKCEGSPAYPDCRASNGLPHPVTGSRVVLTIAHLYADDDTRTMTDITRLKAMCNRCHLTFDAALHRRNAAETRRRKRLNAGQLPLLPETTTDDRDISHTHGEHSDRCHSGKRHRPGHTVRPQRA